MSAPREGVGHTRARFAPRRSGLTARALWRFPGLAAASFGVLRWRWVVPAGAAVAILVLLSIRTLLLLHVLVPYFLDLGVPEEVHPAYIRAIISLVLPAAHLLLTIVAAYCVARRAGTAPRLHGVTVGLVSVVVLQAIGLTGGSLRLGEVALYLVLAVGGGLLGAGWARRALAGRGALYKASRDISAADDAHGIIAAVGEHLAGPEDEAETRHHPPGALKTGCFTLSESRPRKSTKAVDPLRCTS